MNKNKYLKYKLKYLTLKHNILDNMKGGYYENKKEIIEIFYKDNSVIKSFLLYSTREFRDFLSDYNLYKNKKNIYNVFDLHNVLDLLPSDYTIKKDKNVKNICCSYVGIRSKLRERAGDEIIQRMKSGQIDWGVLVFRRGKEHRGQDPNKFHLPGSKAWFCWIIRADNFYDDSLDHILSVESLFKEKNNSINTIQIKNKDHLVEILNN